jgi:DNA-binding NarL/FixJ family response regulator
MKPIRVVLVNEFVILRQGIKKLLEAEKTLEVVGEAADGRQAMKLTQELQPDIVIMDVCLSKLNGLEVTRQIVKSTPSTKVLILTTDEHSHLAVMALEAGASGCLLKESTGQDLMTAIKMVQRGESFLSPSMARRVIGQLVEIAQGTGLPGNDHDSLTSREREILQLVAEGHSSKQIANMLGISEKTVKSHRERLMKKLDLHKTAELVRYALKQGIV